MEVLNAACYLATGYITYKVFDYFYRRPFLSDLDSRYILVTGCDSGFGKAAAKKLDLLGCHVIAACLTEQGEEQLKTECSETLHTVRMDVSNHQSILNALDTVKSILPSGKGKNLGQQLQNPVGTGPFKQHLFNIVCQCCLNINKIV